MAARPLTSRPAAGVRSAAKRAAPGLAAGARRLRLLSGLDGAAAYLHFLTGQGAGTGWDEGEYLVAARRLQGVREPVVVDCGANRGSWTRRVRQELGSSAGRWLLIEPTERLRAELEALPDVEVLVSAAGEVEEERDLFVPQEQSGWMTLHERGDSFAGSKTFRPERVQVVRLDAELARRGIDHVDLLKIDVEGHELFVLKGLGELLTEWRVRALTFEFGSANVNSRTFFRDFWGLLVPAGYDLFRIAPGGILIAVRRYDERLEYFRGATNYLAVARGAAGTRTR